MKNSSHLIKRLKLIMLFASLIFLYGEASSQCLNADFSQNDFSNWIGSTGMNSAGMYSQVVAGIVQGTTNSLPSDTGRHTLMNIQAIDPNCNNLLNVLPPGGSTSCRLGNSDVNYEAERLQYVVHVDATNCLFVYQYAVVLEDPSHPLAEQPKFSIYVLDSLGALVDTVWGIYEVSAAASIPGFNNYGSVRWKDWASVAIDLSAHIGENIAVQFTTYDCAQGAHFGYAYVSCSCGPLAFRQSCNGAVDTVSVPDGFISYLWGTGETTQSVVRTSANFGDSISCRATTETRDTVFFTGTVDCLVSSTGEEIINDGINIYPNPANEKIDISLSPASSSIEQIRITDILGREKYSIENEVLSLDISSFKPGTYFMEIKFRQGVTVKKFIKQ